VSDPPRAVLYARVSTSSQNLDQQLGQLREYAARAGYNVVEEVTDEESGSTERRSGLSQLQYLAHGRNVDVIVVVEMSRLTRRGIGPLLATLREFSENGVEVVSLREAFLSTVGPTRDLLVSIFGWVAQQERQVIRERTRSALRQRKALGVRLGAESLCECGHRRKALRRDGGRLIHAPGCGLCGCPDYRPRVHMTGGSGPPRAAPVPE
jgi:putative DNA-invertase from lambdoid prophage Rac